jgi:uncharacterized protein (TIGR02217 family)
MSATFHEVLFPVSISYGSTGGPLFKTTIFTSDSGYEQRNIDWQNVRCEYDAQQGIKTEDQMAELLTFFMARRGRAYGFRYFDWLDNEITDQSLGFGDGTTTTFQLVKAYTNYQPESETTVTYTRTITKPAWDTFSGVMVGGVLKVEGTDFSVDYTTGIITFGVAPQGPLDVDGALIPPGATTTVVTPALEVVVGDVQFHVPVRFDTDQLDASQDYFNTQSWPSIKMVEVRDWNEAIG